MSKYSPTVLPQPDGAGAAIAQGLANGFQNFLAIRNAREGRLRQQQQDTAAAQQREFQNALQMRQMALQEQAAQRQREELDLRERQGGYTPATDTTIDLGPLGQALAGQAGGAGLTGAVLQQTPASTLHMPASYDFTKSQSYQSAQAAATRAAQAAEQQAQRERDTHRINRQYDIANPLPARPRAAGAGATQETREHYRLRRIPQLTHPAGKDIYGHPLPGMSPDKAAAQADQEYNAAHGGEAGAPTRAPGLATFRAGGADTSTGGPSLIVNGAPVTQGPPEIAPPTPDTSALSVGAQKVIGRINEKGLTVRDALISPSVPDAVKAELVRYYRLNYTGGGAQ